MCAYVCVVMHHSRPLGAILQVPGTHAIVCVPNAERQPPCVTMRIAERRCKLMRDNSNTVY